MTTTALLIRLQEVDRKIRRATDPAYTVLSEHGIRLLREYRAELLEELDGAPESER
jgi:hypothetical protein